MTELYRVLFDYGQARMADHYLLMEQEAYTGAVGMYERALAVLRGSLSEADLEELDKVVDGLEMRAALDRESLFLSGLSGGPSLGRLGA